MACYQVYETMTQLSNYHVPVVFWTCLVLKQFLCWLDHQHQELHLLWSKCHQCCYTTCQLHIQWLQACAQPGDYKAHNILCKQELWPGPNTNITSEEGSQPTGPHNHNQYQQVSVQRCLPSWIQVSHSDTSHKETDTWPRSSKELPPSLKSCFRLQGPRKSCGSPT